MGNDRIARYRKRLTTLLLAVALVACHGGGGDDEYNPVAAAAEEAVAQGLVGAVFGRATGDEMVMAAAGTTRQQGGRALTVDHRFALGSNGKSITALLAADMVASGELSWSSTIGELLPELSASMDPAYQQVTLIMLLDHRSGMLPLTDGEELERYDGELPDDPWLRRLAVVGWILHQPPVVAPGTDFVYSNAGYTVAGAMLEKVGGDSYLNLVNERVLAPLGITAGQSLPAADDEEQPFGHLGAQDALVELDPQDPVELLILDAIAPAGSLTMTGDDYGRYLQWHLQALAGETTPLPPPYVERLQMLAAGDYSLGWQAIAGVGGTLLFHLGETAGFTTLAVMDQQGSSVLWALTNSGDEGDGWVNAVLLEQAAVL